MKKTVPKITPKMGRPRIAEAGKDATIHARVTVEQLAKYQRIGAGEWLRGAINKAKDKAA
jgi:hypothetical protein